MHLATCGIADVARSCCVNIAPASNVQRGLLAIAARYPDAKRTSASPDKNWVPWCMGECGWIAPWRPSTSCMLFTHGRNRSSNPCLVRWVVDFWMDSPQAPCMLPSSYTALSTQRTVVTGERQETILRSSQTLQHCGGMDRTGNALRDGQAMAGFGCRPSSNAPKAHHAFALLGTQDMRTSCMPRSLALARAKVAACRSWSAERADGGATAAGLGLCASVAADVQC